MSYQLCFGLLQLQLDLLLLQLQKLFLFGQQLLSDQLLLGQAALADGGHRLWSGRCWWRRLGGDRLRRGRLLILERRRGQRGSEVKEKTCDFGRLRGSEADFMVLFIPQGKNLAVNVSLSLLLPAQ